MVLWRIIEGIAEPLRCQINSFSGWKQILLTTI
jgi:hypothetical protein